MSKTLPYNDLMADSSLSSRSERSAESSGRIARSNRFEIEHVSRYRYASPAWYSVMSLCLRPRESVRQQLLQFDLSTHPLATLSTAIDPYGNTKHVFSVHQRHEALEIKARSSVETGPAAQLPGSLDSGAWDKIQAWQHSFALWDFTHDSPLAQSSPALSSFIQREGIEPADDPLQAVGMLSEKLHHVFDYVPGSTSVASPIDHILETGRGVCQDYAHVMIAIARSWGVPSRYVSGYVHVSGESHEHALTSWQTADFVADADFVAVADFVADAADRHPRVGRVPVARPRLGWFRSHQPDPCRRPPRFYRCGTRLPGRAPFQRHSQRFR